jgi:hypothetical protein
MVRVPFPNALTTLLVQCSQEFWSDIQWVHEWRFTLQFNTPRWFRTWY